MMGDDHGWEETGYNGHPHVKTPVLDEMAATGLKFEIAFTPRIRVARPHARVS
jgi:arylsulfatase A-like enzyme